MLSFIKMLPKKFEMHKENNVYKEQYAMSKHKSSKVIPVPTNVSKSISPHSK